MTFTLNSTWIANEAQAVSINEKAGRYLGIAQFGGHYSPAGMKEPEMAVVVYQVTKNEWLAVNVKVENRTKTVTASRKAHKKELQACGTLDALVSFVANGKGRDEFLSEDTQEWLAGVERVNAADRAQWSALQKSESRMKAEALESEYEYYGIESEAEKKAYRTQKSMQRMLDQVEDDEREKLESDFRSDDLFVALTKKEHNSKW